MRALGRLKIDSQACGRRTLVEIIYSEIAKKKRLRQGLINFSGLPKSLRNNLDDNTYALTLVIWLA
jgi:hypothetical protein